MKFSKFLQPLTSLSTLVLLAALDACNEQKASPPAATDSTPAAATATPAAPAPVAQAPRIVHFSMGDDVKSADPATSNDTISAEFMGHIFEGLLGFTYLGKLGAVEPVLAESMPIFSNQNKTIKFRIKRDVFFQDDPAFPEGKGRAVTAADFVYSIKRLGDPTVSSPNWWMFDGAVDGFNEWRDAIEKAPADKRKELFEAPVKGLVDENTNTLVFHLKRSYPQILPILAMTPTAVVAREVVEKYGPEIINHPVGTGPYHLTEWIRGSKIIVEKSPKFRKEFYPAVGSDEDRQAGLLVAAGKAVPFLDAIHWDVIKEEQPRWLKFRSGQLDESGIPKDNFSDAIDATGGLNKDLASKGFVLHKAMSLTSWWLEFNLKDPVLGKNVKLRKALALAFDRARALELLYNNRGILAQSPIPTTLEGGSSLPAYPYEYNLEKAKALLAEAGFPEGKGLPQLTFDLRGPGTTARQLGELLADNYSKIGVKLAILANSFPEALEKSKTSRFQIMLGGWAADYPDPENFLQLFVSSNAAPGTNSSNFKNKTYDDLYEQMRTMLPSAARETKIKKMVEILTNEMPVAFFFHAVDYRISRKWLKNYHPHLLLYGLGKYLDVDTAEKEQLLKTN